MTTFGSERFYLKQTSDVKLVRETSPSASISVVSSFVGPQGVRQIFPSFLFFLQCFHLCSEAERENLDWFSLATRECLFSLSLHLLTALLMVQATHMRIACKSPCAFLCSSKSCALISRRQWTEPWPSSSRQASSLMGFNSKSGKKNSTIVCLVPLLSQPHSHFLTWYRSRKWDLEISSICYLEMTTKKKDTRQMFQKPRSE